MDPTAWSAIIGGLGTAGWTGKELVRQSKEIKTLKAERDGFKKLADQHHSELLAKDVLLARSESRFAAMEGQLKALTEQVSRQADEIKDLRTQLAQMEGGHA